MLKIQMLTIYLHYRNIIVWLYLVTEVLWLDKLTDVTPYRFSLCRGALMQPPPVCRGWRKRLPRHDLLGEERWLISQRRRARSLFLNGLLCGSVCTGVQVKLINHCQAVRVKQYIIYRELWGLILSYSQLVRQP